MKQLIQYIQESYENEMLKLSAEDKETLIKLDDEYGELMLIARYETVVREILNKEEEFEKFKKLYIENHEIYYPVIEHSKLEYEKYDLKNRIEKLVHKFSNFNCFLSKYYIENLNGVLSKITYLENLDNDDYIYDVTEKLNNFDDALLDKAKKIIHDEPFHFKHGDMYDRTITADEAADTIHEKLKQLGYDWHIIMRENMLPRMGVNPEKTFRIKPSAKFSKIDIESLIVHEIKAHVAKRYYGYQLGLFLFVFGLSGKNMFDEGLAIWNTFNMLDTPKPNAKFNIAISYLVCYYCCKYDFCDAFDKIKELVKDADYSDFAIFSQMMRSKRSTIRTDRRGYWSGDIDYFRGYEAVNNMSTEEREKILKYNVGKMQFFELPTIEKFFELNKFDPISNTRLNKILKKYTPK